MAKTARLELRVEPELKFRLVHEADRRGMKVATFVERAIAAALEFEGDLPKPGILNRAPKVEVALEAREASAKRRAGKPVAFQEPVTPGREKVYGCPEPRCIFVSVEPGVCVHHRTRKLVAQ